MTLMDATQQRRTSKTRIELSKTIDCTIGLDFSSRFQRYVCMYLQMTSAPLARLEAAQLSSFEQLHGSSISTHISHISKQSFFLKRSFAILPEGQNSKASLSKPSFLWISSGRRLEQKRHVPYCPPDKPHRCFGQFDSVFSHSI